MSDSERCPGFAGELIGKGAIFGEVAFWRRRGLNSVRRGKRDGGWIFSVVWRIGRGRGWGGSDGCCGAFGENRLAGAGAVGHGLGVMLENRRICNQPDQIEEQVGMVVGGRLRAAVTEGRMASSVAGEGAR